MASDRQLRSGHASGEERPILGGIMRRTTALFIAVALVLTACQSATEKLTERALEQAISASDIDFDVDTGEIKIETDDESISIGGGELPGGSRLPFRTVTR